MNKMFVLLLPLNLLLNISSAQTGIFIYPDTTVTNLRISFIMQSKDGNIYATGTTTDADDQNPQPLFIKTTKEGTLLDLKKLDVPNMVEYSGFYPLPEYSGCTQNCTYFRLFGTTGANSVGTLYNQTVNSSGDLIDNEMSMSFQSRLMGNMAKINDSEDYYCFDLKTPDRVFNARLMKEKSRMVQEEGMSSPMLVSEQEKYVSIYSAYNEFCLSVIPGEDSSVYLFCGRNYSDSNEDYIIYKINSLDSVVWKSEIASRKNSEASGLFKTWGDKLTLVLSCGGKSGYLNTKTVLMQVDMKTGDTTSVLKTFDGMRSEGMLQLRNGNFVLYGGEFHGPEDSLTASVYIKAKWVMLDKNFKTIKEDEMGMMDAPDANLPGLYMSLFPSMSELLGAVQLSDGRIAFCGRVYMPLHTGPDEIYYSRKLNRPLLFITDENGNFRKE